jgi:hypothetical protein
MRQVQSKCEPAAALCETVQRGLLREAPSGDLAVFAHISLMAVRPCKIDEDLARLWQTILGTPFPACGSMESSDEASNGSTPLASLPTSVGRVSPNQPRWARKRPNKDI